MMIQPAPQGSARFISTMAEHNDLCGQFARAFGNAEFERPEPWDEVLYAIAHHDRGWDAFDANPALDEKSGFPRGLGTAPIAGGLETTRRSPDFNEARHAYCGLLASMHCWGLYNARYGYSDFRAQKGGSTSIPVPPAQADAAKKVLDAELARQARLKERLAADPRTAPWVEESRLMQNYKLLQFFDTLALYFNLRHESERAEEAFLHVPKSRTTDTTVTVRPRGGGGYAMNPFPFAGARMEARCKGRYFEAVAPERAPADLAAHLYGRPAAEQVFVFLPR
jgi:hypothetical protein